MDVARLRATTWRRKPSREKRSSGEGEFTTFSTAKQIFSRSRQSSPKPGYIQRSFLASSVWYAHFAAFKTNRPVVLNSFPLASYNSTKASQRLKINKNTVKINLMKPLAAGFFVILVSQNSQ